MLAGTDKVITSNDQNSILGNYRALRPANDHEKHLNNLDLSLLNYTIDLYRLHSTLTLTTLFLL